MRAKLSVASSLLALTIAVAIALLPQFVSAAGTVVVTPKHPRPGESVTIIYNTTGGPLATAPDVLIRKGVNGWAETDPTDSPLIRLSSGSAWFMNYKIPEGATEINFAFHDGAQSWDNNDGKDWRLYTVLFIDNTTLLAEMIRRAEAGDLEAIVLVGEISYDRKDFADAARWFRKAADRGDADAQASLGLMYVLGYGLPHDSAEAVRLFRRAADQGDMIAGFSLAQTLIQTDLTEAAQWFRMAADRGHPFAQLQLALMYQNGYGVPQNLAEATGLFRRVEEAAEQGLPIAQKALAVMYQNGHGVAQDPAQAAFWSSKAADLGVREKVVQVPATQAVEESGDPVRANVVRPPQGGPQRATNTRDVGGSADAATPVSYIELEGRVFDIFLRDTEGTELRDLLVELETRLKIVPYDHQSDVIATTLWFLPSGVVIGYRPGYYLRFCRDGSRAVFKNKFQEVGRFSAITHRDGACVLHDGDYTRDFGVYRLPDNRLVLRKVDGVSTPDPFASQEAGKQGVVMIERLTDKKVMRGPYANACIMDGSGKQDTTGVYSRVRGVINGSVSYDEVVSKAEVFSDALGGVLQNVSSYPTGRVTWEIPDLDNLDPSGFFLRGTLDLPPSAGRSERASQPSNSPDSDPSGSSQPGSAFPLLGRTSPPASSSGGVDCRISTSERHGKAVMSGEGFSILVSADSPAAHDSMARGCDNLRLVLSSTVGWIRPDKGVSVFTDIKPIENFYFITDRSPSNRDGQVLISLYAGENLIQQLAIPVSQTGNPLHQSSSGGGIQPGAQTSPASGMGRPGGAAGSGAGGSSKVGNGKPAQGASSGPVAGTGGTKAVYPVNYSDLGNCPADKKEQIRQLYASAKQSRDNAALMGNNGTGPGRHEGQSGYQIQMAEAYEKAAQAIKEKCW